MFRLKGFLHGGETRVVLVARIFSGLKVVAEIRAFEIREITRDHLAHLAVVQLLKRAKVKSACKLEQTFGRKVWRLHVVDGENVLAALQCLSYSLPMGKEYLYAPHGPVFFTDDVELYDTIIQNLYRGLKIITDKQEFVFVRIEPS